MRKLIVLQLVNDRSRFKKNSSLMKFKFLLFYLGISGNTSSGFQTSKGLISEQVGKGSECHCCYSVMFFSKD